MDTFDTGARLLDWWFVNGRFYYSKLSGSDYFNQISKNTSPRRGGQITLHRESEIFSVANLFTPLNGLTLSLGAQNEWTRESGFSESIPDLELLTGTIPANSDMDEFKASQNANVRFSKMSPSPSFPATRSSAKIITASSRRKTRTKCSAIPRRTMFVMI